MRDVIIACDFPNKEATLDFIRRFEGDKPYLKIGMELFYGEGPDIVRQVKDMGFHIFLDLKLFDIPNTVKRAMTNLARLGVDMVNVHSLGTIGMMEAAKEGLLAGGGDATKLIAITLTTSTSQEALREELWVDHPLNDTIIHYAQNTKKAGLDGIVCSPLEARMVKDACGEGFVTVTPGIRYPDAAADDQSRITTPAKAREIGTDFIVVGRPITAAADPVAAYARIKKDFLG